MKNEVRFLHALNNPAVSRPSWLLLWGPVVGYCILIFVLSAQPDVDLPAVIPLMDKAAHGLLYAGLGWLWARAVRVSQPGWKTPAVLVSTLCFATIYGLSDEWHQLSVSGRFADWHDVLADACGGTAGGLGYCVWGRFRLRVGRG